MYQANVRAKQPIALELGPGLYGYFQIAEQWNAMLDDAEAAEWGAGRILRLLDLVDGLQNKDDTMRVFGSPEWKEIVGRRGPAEGAWEVHCGACGLRNIGFYTSGFVSEVYRVDYDSRVVRWRPLQPDDPSPRDESRCAKCGSLLGGRASRSVFAVLNGFDVTRSED